MLDKISQTYVLQNSSCTQMDAFLFFVNLILCIHVAAQKQYFTFNLFLHLKCRQKPTQPTLKI